MRQRGRWTFAVSLAFNPRILRGMRQVVFVVHNRIPCTFNPRILRGMRHQFCTNNNSIYWYNLLNINNNLSTRYYYLAHLILAKTIHTLFFRCESPSKIMYTSHSHISYYPRIPRGMRQNKRRKSMRKNML